MRYPTIPRLLLPLTAAAAVSGLPDTAFTAAEPLSGVVSHVKVISNHVEDVSSLEAWKKSFIKDGMTDEEKALAVWKSVV
jgi:hypothetical protein